MTPTVETEYELVRTLQPKNGGDMTKKILIGITIIIISSWIGYISLRGITTNDNLAIVKMDVEVLKVKQAVMVEDLQEIKSLSRAIRDDQIRRQKSGK